MDAFLADTSPNAYEKVVDRLLASPRYGERMAFRWMEAARYADTNGYQTDGVRDMWRWRDWVIDAFNRNMPFDQFTIEQLAGDLLPNPTLDQRIATGFHRNHRTSAEGGIVPEEFRVEYVADRAETTSTVWLGLTVGCARCHDHKYDPIQQKELLPALRLLQQRSGKGLGLQLRQRRAVHQGAHAARAEAAGGAGPERGRARSSAGRRWSRSCRRHSDSGSAEQLASKLAGLDARRRAAFFARLPAIWRRPAAASRRTPATSRRRTPRRPGPPFRRQAVPRHPTKDVANFDYLEPFTFAAWIKPDAPKGAILSHAEDYFEGQGHGLYLIDGKIRLHVIFRWTDIGLRLETVDPVKLNEWQHVLVTYDGKHEGVRRPHLRRWRSRRSSTSCSTS